MPKYNCPKCNWHSDVHEFDKTNPNRLYCAHCDLEFMPGSVFRVYTPLDKVEQAQVIKMLEKQDTVSYRGFEICKYITCDEYYEYSAYRENWDGYINVASLPTLLHIIFLITKD